MGLFNFLFGKRKNPEDAPRQTEGLPGQINTDVLKGFDTEEFDKEQKVITDEIKELQTNNRIWEKHSSRTYRNREIARNLEKEGQLQKAIDLYTNSISSNEESAVLNYSNYAFDINRLVILLSKTKQTDKLERFLKHLVERYPEKNEVADWNKRLQKITQTGS